MQDWDKTWDDADAMVEHLEADTHIKESEAWLATISCHVHYAKQAIALVDRQAHPLPASPAARLCEPLAHWLAALCCTAGAPCACSHWRQTDVALAHAAPLLMQLPRADLRSACSFAQHGQTQGENALFDLACRADSVAAYKLSQSSCKVSNVGDKLTACRAVYPARTA